MPGCVAVNCSNSTKKGFIMKRFPKDPIRRKEWCAKTKRENWTPTDNSYLCEVHFAPEMWEKTRQDGTRVLKRFAVPTIFSFSKPITARKPPTFRKLLSSNEAMSLPTDKFTQPEDEDDKRAQPSTSTSGLIFGQSDQISDGSSSVEENMETISPLIVLENDPKITERFEKYESLLFKERAKTIKYKRLLRNARNKIKSLQNQIHTSSKPRLNGMLENLFNKDQIMALKKKHEEKSTKFMKWSNETVTKSLRLKFSCGNNGYEELLKQGLPLPSIRTLQRKLQNLKFDSGILDEVFNFLKLKVEGFEPHERDCVLVLDEMAITPGSTFDSSLNKYFGDITLPQHSGTATHVLVFMLGGIATRWKQVVGYYFTGDSVNGAVFKGIIEEIFLKVEELNLNIISITSDMGACNQALWKSWGISAGKNSPIKTQIANPVHRDKYVNIFADVPHLFKNVKSMLVNNKIIKLQKHIVQKYSLLTDEVLACHINEILAHQESHSFKLTPKLSEQDLMPTHYSKMKVSTSTNVINHTVSSALKFLAEELKKPAYLTTAWFLDQIEKWFYLMTSRHPSGALSKFNIKVYNESVQFLNDFMDIIASIEVGYKKIWKPSQTGILLSTKSMLEVQHHLLDSKGYKFILTSRFSQDCLENLFSVLRSKQIVPNAVQVKNNLKLICISQYLKNASRSSYEDDDREVLSGFLDSIKNFTPAYEDVKIPSNLNVSFNLSHSELNSLYNVCGYIIQSLIKTSNTCQICINAVGSKTPVYKKFTKFSLIKRFKEHSLFFCNEIVFYFFLEMESVFSKYFSIVYNQNINIKEFYVKEMSDLNLNIPNCHKLKEKIISRFIVFRLKIASKKYAKKSQKLASKSVAGYLL